MSQQLQMSGNFRGSDSRTSNNNRGNQYLLIEDNVRDTEYHLRKQKCKRYLLLIIILISVIIGIALLAIVLDDGKLFNSDTGTASASNDNTPSPITNHSLECQPFPDKRECPFNAQYPMAGGAGCSKECVTDQYSASLNFESPIDSDILTMVWPQAFLDKINTATIETRDIIDDELCLTNNSIFQFDEKTSTVHMTLDYFCCLTYDQLQTVNDICEKFIWERMDIRFDHVICTQDGWHDGVFYENNTYIEIVTVVSNTSQAILLGAVTELEQQIIDAGIPIRVPRRDNIEFHVTIGFVNGTAVGSVPDLVDEINEVVTWSDLEITIDQPNGHICTQSRNPIGNDEREFSCLTGFS